MNAKIIYILEHLHCEIMQAQEDLHDAEVYEDLDIGLSMQVVDEIEAVLSDYLFSEEVEEKLINACDIQDFTDDELALLEEDEDYE